VSYSFVLLAVGKIYPECEGIRSVCKISFGSSIMRFLSSSFLTLLNHICAWVFDFWEDNIISLPTDAFEIDFLCCRSNFFEVSAPFESAKSVAWCLKSPFPILPGQSFKVSQFHKSPESKQLDKRSAITSFRESGWRSLIISLIEATGYESSDDFPDWILWITSLELDLAVTDLECSVLQFKMWMQKRTLQLIRHMKLITSNGW